MQTRTTTIQRDARNLLFTAFCTNQAAGKKNANAIIYIRSGCVESDNCIQTQQSNIQREKKVDYLKKNTRLWPSIVSNRSKHNQTQILYFKYASNSGSILRADIRCIISATKYMRGYQMYHQRYYMYARISDVSLALLNR